MKVIPFDFIPKEEVVIKETMVIGKVLECVCDSNLSKKYLVRYHTPNLIVIQDWFYSHELELYIINE